MAFFQGEPAGAVVEAILHQAAHEKVPLLLCVVNWGEIYYGTWRAGGKKAADALVEDLSTLPSQLVVADLALTEQAAAFKATRKMSMRALFRRRLGEEKEW